MTRSTWESSTNAKAAVRSTTISASPINPARCAAPNQGPATKAKKNSRAAPTHLTPVAISLGGNDDRSAELIQSAITALSATLTEVRVASLYCTAPISEIEQPDFVNTAATGWTECCAEELMGILKACEQLHGRRRGRRWGPRPLDLDLLLYGDVVSQRPELWLPHPRLRRRRFYLQPLSEIAPHLTVPPDGATVSQLLDKLPADAEERRLDWPGSTIPDRR